MKKFASLSIAVLLVISMLLTSVISASAVTGIDFDKTGTIRMVKYDLNDTTQTVEGATFKAYKVLALNNDGDTDGTYTVEKAFKSVITEADLKSAGKTGSNGGLYISTEALEEKITSLEACTSNADGVVFKETEEKGDGVYTATDLALGVYLVVETAAPDGYIKATAPFLVTVPQWDGDADEWDYVIGDNGQEIKPKNIKVGLVKTQGNGKKQGIYAIGDTIDYTVTAKLPDYGTVESTNQKYTATLSAEDRELILVKFDDKMTEGLTYDKNLVIEVDDVTTAEEGDTVKLTADDYKSLKETDRGFVVELKWDSIEAYQGAIVTLKYSAKLNNDAVVDDGSNDNTVTYEYSSSLVKEYIGPDDPNYPYDPEDPDYGISVPVFPSEELKDTTKAFTFALDLTKTFNGKTAEKAGVDATKVAFKLIDKATGKYIAVVKTAEGKYAVNTAATATNDNTVMNLAADGTLYVKGLKVAGYYLEETKAADGYSKLTTKVEFVLSEDSETPGTVAGQYFVKNKANDMEETGSNTVALTVNNVKKQFELPTTGGLGIWMFTIAGGILMAGAIILFVSIRKKSTSK